MANLFVRSADGSDSDNGSTWALAKATLAGAAAVDGPGDTIFLSASHSEASNAVQTISLAGTLGSPTRVLCVDDTGDPSSPTTLATTAVVQTGAGAFTLAVSGNAYVYGVSFRMGVGGGSSVSLALVGSDGNKGVFERCEFVVGATSPSSGITLGAGGSAFEASATWIDCDVSFSHVSQAIKPTQCRFRWSGGGIKSGSSAVNTLIAQGNDQFDALLEGLDLSGGATGMVIFGGGANGVGVGVIRNCRLPSGWSGDVMGTPTTANLRGEMYNCDDGDTNYRMRIVDYAGKIRDEQVIVRTGGATDPDAVGPLSWRLEASSNASYPLIPLRTPEIALWNSTVGSPVTFSVEIVHDAQGSGSGGRLLDTEIALSLQFAGTAGVPMSTITSNAAPVLSTGAAHADSSETWTTTGMTSPIKQVLEVTVTPQERGWVLANVELYLASAVVYVCPKMTAA